MRETSSTVSSRRRRRGEDHSAMVRLSEKCTLFDASSNGTDRRRTKPGGKRYKSQLICAICNGNAHGYNFDAISCESCKAFFRRNAMRPPGKLKCRGNGHCDISSAITKRCKKCRLEKCVQSGMRKEWILSDKEKQAKRDKIEQNRLLKLTTDANQARQDTKSLDLAANVDELLLDLVDFQDGLVMGEYDWFIIHCIKTSYADAVRLNQIVGIAVYPATQRIDSTLHLFCIPLHNTAMRLVTFIKQLTEFQQLPQDDQIHLVKLNLLTVCFFHSIFLYDPTTDAYHEENTTDPLYPARDWTNTLDRPFHAAMKQLRKDLMDIFQWDDTIVKLVFLILLFSNQVSLRDSPTSTPTRISSAKIFHAQNVFTDLIFKYCVHQYGLAKASTLFARYVSKLMKLQQLVDEMRHHIHDYVDPSQLSPLMESLLL